MRRKSQKIGPNYIVDLEETDKHIENCEMEHNKEQDYVNLDVDVVENIALVLFENDGEGENDKNASMDEDGKNTIKQIQRR